MSIAGVQARVMELQSALSAVSQPVTPPASAATTASSQFSNVLADQLGGRGAVPGGVGGQWAAQPGGQLTGQWPAGGLSGQLVTTLAGGPAGAGFSTVGGAGSAGPALPGTGAALVESAKKYLGVPYVWGGESLSEGGLDCSGLVQLSLFMAGQRVSRDTDMQAKEIGRAIDPRATLRRGDLVFWRGHVAIMTDGENIIHASGHGMIVEREPLAAAIQRIEPLYGAPVIYRRPD